MVNELYCQSLAPHHRSSPVWAENLSCEKTIQWSCERSVFLPRCPLSNSQVHNEVPGVFLRQNQLDDPKWPSCVDRTINKIESIPFYLFCITGNPFAALAGLGGSGGGSAGGKLLLLNKTSSIGACLARTMHMREVVQNNVNVQTTISIIRC